MAVPASVNKQIEFLKNLVSADKDFISNGADTGDDISGLKISSIDDVANPAFSPTGDVTPLSTIGSMECYDFVVANNMYVDLYIQSRDDYYAIVKDDTYNEVVNAQNQLSYLSSVYSKWLG